MTDVTTVWDCFGNLLDELPVNVPRGDNVVRDVSADKGFFTIPLTHAKATARNLKNRNIILVQSNQPGIRRWAAVIDEPEPTGTEVTDGELSIKLRGAEIIFSTRYTASKDIFSGSSGQVVIGLIGAARREGVIPISTDMSGVDKGGASLGNIEFNNANIFEAINSLAEANDAYWWLEPIILVSNKLTLKFFWKFKRTATFNTPLVSTGANRNFTISKVNQSGKLANHVKAYARTSDWNVPIEYEEKSQRSIGYYGNVYTYVIPALDQTTREGLIPIVKAYLKKSAFPPLYVDGLITSAPFPGVGYVCTVYLDNYGPLITARRGGIVYMTVESTFYSPADNSLAVHLREIIA